MYKDFLLGLDLYDQKCSLKILVAPNVRWNIKNLPIEPSFYLQNPQVNWKPSSVKSFAFRNGSRDIRDIIIDQMLEK